MQTKSEKESSNVIKYPGKVDIVKNNKVVETLPAHQKIYDKKANKAALKSKPNAGGKLNYADLKDNDHKSPEQNLETYSNYNSIQS